MASSPYRDILDEIKFAINHNFDGIEISIEYPNASPESLAKRRREIIELLSSYPLTRLAHAPAFLNICDAHHSVWEATLRELVRVLEVAYQLDVKLVTVHPGYLWPNMTRETALGNLISALETLLHAASDFGLTLGLENLPPPPRGFFTEPEDFRRLFRRLKDERLKFVFDFAHASIGSRASPFSFIDLLFEEMRHIHLSDNLGEKDNHLPLGTGRVDYRGMIERLKSKGYDRTMTLEVFSEDSDYLLLSKKKVEALLRDEAR